MKTRHAFGLLVPVLALTLGLTAHGKPEEPTSVILMVGDGMGFEQIRAASLYAYGREGALAIERLPVRAAMTTHSAESATTITDSAAAATAMATGRKSNRGVLSVAIPGDGAPLQTSLEYHRDRGLATGLVTTTYMTHATPAGFASHVASRNALDEIAEHYMTLSRPNVLLGGVRGGGRGMTPQRARDGGYTVVTDRAELFAAAADPPAYISGQFGTGHMPYEYDQAEGKTDAYNRLPRLSEMTRAALAILESNPKGFFLMVEGGRIDHAGHSNETERNIFETIEFDRTVHEVLRWADGREDVLILVTSDHETGGLRVREDRGIGRFPTVTWSTGGHTGVNVPVFAQGPGAETIGEVIDITDIFHLCVGRAPQSEASQSAPAARPAAAPAAD